MLDPRITQHVQEAMRVEVGDFERDLALQMRQARTRGGAGGLNDSTVLRGVASALHASLDARAKHAFEEIRRALELYRPTLDDTLSNYLAGLHFTETRRECSDLQNLVDRQFNTPAASAFGPQPIGRLQGSLNNQCGQLRDKYTFEIRALVQSLRQREQKPTAAAGVTINAGHIGAVLSGPHASATVTMHVGDADRAALFAAIEQLVAALQSTKQIGREQQQDLLAIIGQVKIATQEPSPKPALLRSLLIGLAHATQTIAAVGPAWELIRSAVRPLGINLPPPP